jgi:hypothetical protein
MDFDDESEASRLRAFVPKFGEPSVRDTHADTLLLQSAGSMLHFYNSYKHTPNKLKHNLLQTLLPSHLLIFLLHLFYVFFARFGEWRALPTNFPHSWENCHRREISSLWFLIRSKSRVRSFRKFRYAAFSPCPYGQQLTLSSFTHMYVGQVSRWAKARLHLRHFSAAEWGLTSCMRPSYLMRLSRAMASTWTVSCFKYR